MKLFFAHLLFVNFTNPSLAVEGMDLVCESEEDVSFHSYEKTLYLTDSGEAYMWDIEEYVRLYMRPDLSKEKRGKAFLHQLKGDLETVYEFHNTLTTNGALVQVVTVTHNGESIEVPCELVDGIDSDIIETAERIY